MTEPDQVNDALPAPPVAAPKPSLRQRFHARMQQVAASRFALLAMSGLSFADACVSPIIPEVLLVPMCLLHRTRCYLYAFWASVASVLGGMAGYFLGFFLWEHGLREFAYESIPGFTPEWFEKVSSFYGGQAFLWVWLAGFTPLPYKVFTVLAGVCHDDVPFATFVLASALSRTPRFYLTVWVLVRFGPPVFVFLQRRIGPVFLVLLLIVLAIVLWVQLG